MSDKKKELEEALMMVSPLMKIVGISKKETKIVLEYIQECSDTLGISTNEAAIALRVYLNKKR